MKKNNFIGLAISKHSKLRTYFFFFFGLLFLVACQRTISRSTDHTQIISLVYHQSIGAEEHFGQAPPIPPLPPDFSALNNYTSEQSARKALTDSLWQHYFAVSEAYQNQQKAWEKRMRRLPRKIILQNTTQLTSAEQDLVKTLLNSKGIKQDFLAKKNHWESSKINNQSLYTIVDEELLDNDTVLDSIYIGKMSFSTIGFNFQKNKAALYFRWQCQRLCGYTGLALLVKQKGKWEILSLDYLSVS